MIERVEVKTEGLTVSQLVHQRLGRTPGALAATLDATPGLAAQGSTLAPGTVVRIPIPDEPVADRPEVVTLWD